MKEQDIEFIAEVYSKAMEIEQLVIKRGYSDRVMSAFVFGIIAEDAVDEDGMVDMTTFHSYNLQDEQELQSIKDIMDATYDSGDDLSGFFDELGLGLN